MYHCVDRDTSTKSGYPINLATTALNQQILVKSEENRSSVDGSMVTLG